MGTLDRLPTRMGLGVLLVATMGCSAAGSGAPVPTPCGGSHAWPPNGYPDLVPPGIEVMPMSEVSLRITNDTESPWWFEAAAWGESDCAGWTAFTPNVRDAIPAGEERTVTLADPAAGTPFRLAVAFRDRPCDACPDPPSGFWSGFVEDPDALD